MTDYHGHQPRHCSDEEQPMTGNVTSVLAVIQVAQLAKVIRGMTPKQLLQYEAQGEIDLPPHHFNAGEIKVCSSHWLHWSMLPIQGQVYYGQKAMQPQSTGHVKTSAKYRAIEHDS